MNTISTLLLFTTALAAAPPQEAVVVKDIQVKTRGDKKTGTLHIFVNKNEEPVRFLKMNRCVAGTWDFTLDRAKETPTHWTGVMHYPTFNHRPEQFYLSENIKIIKRNQLHKLPAAARAEIAPFFTNPKERGQLKPGQGRFVLRETGQPNEYELIGYSTDDVFGLFKLNNQLKYTGPPRPAVGPRAVARTERRCFFSLDPWNEEPCQVGRRGTGAGPDRPPLNTFVHRGHTATHS